MAKDFAQAWAEQNGGYVTPSSKHTANGYQISVPFPVHPHKTKGAYFERKLKTIPVRSIVPTPQQRRELAAYQEWHLSTAMAFSRCLQDLEKWANQARYSSR